MPERDPSDGASMRALRRLARIIGVVVLVVLGFALLFPPAYSMIASEDMPPEIRLPPAPPDQYTIYVADWGYHTSIIVPQPAPWILGPVGREHAPFVEYAWGDRRFYRDSDYRIHSVFATLVLPTASVAYVAGHDRPPTSSMGARAVYRRDVDARTLHALVTALEETVRHDASGNRVRPAEPVAGFAGRFYDAHGAYLWTRDCNRWTVERLAAADLASGGRLVVFAGQVASRLHGFTAVGAG